VCKSQRIPGMMEFALDGAQDASSDLGRERNQVSRHAHSTDATAHKEIEW
jgi:hypothetical protein